MFYDVRIVNFQGTNCSFLNQCEIVYDGTMKLADIIEMNNEINSVMNVTETHTDFQSRCVFTPSPIL